MYQTLKLKSENWGKQSLVDRLLGSLIQKITKIRPNLKLSERSKTNNTYDSYHFIFLICSSFYPGSDLGEDPCLVVKSLRLSDLKTFMKHILTPIEMVDNRTSHGQDLFERSIIIKVLESFSIFDQSVIFSFDDTSLDDVANDILFEENCSTVELQDIPTNTSTHLDPMQLSDKTIIDNFSNQDGQLVCLVCYKIFLSNSDFSTFRKHLSEHSLPIRKWGHLLSETLSEAPSSKSKLMEPPKPFLKTFKGPALLPLLSSIIDKLHQ